MLKTLSLSVEALSLDLKILSIGLETLSLGTVSYTHLRAHETKANLVCRLLLEKKTVADDMHARRPLNCVRLMTAAFVYDFR